MKEGYVKNANGILMIVIHFGAIFYIFQGVSARLEPKDQIALVMILSPLTAAFVSLFLKDAVKKARQVVDDAYYSVSFASVTVLLTVLYGATLLFILFNFLKNTDINADMLKLYIGVIETIIGGFVGIVYGELYK
jgi:hypothetical protein